MSKTDMHFHLEHVQKEPLDEQLQEQQHGADDILPLTAAGVQVQSHALHLATRHLIMFTWAGSDLFRKERPPGQVTSAADWNSS